MRVRILVTASLAALLLPTGPATAAPPGHAHGHPHRSHPVVPCSRGLVALTFDDGPVTTVTPRLVRVLRRLQVPATFFMVGSRVAEHPEVVRLVDRAGFTIGNHTWAHTDLTTQTPRQVHHALASTRRALVAAGVEPSDLARPPYGAIDTPARREMSDLGLVPVLWTIDSRDWTGLSSGQIRDGVVGDVHPHRTNVVLQHDGVDNSPATLRAVPQEVALLRQRGYCFAALDAAGRPTPPVPLATVEADRSRITEGDRVRLVVRLDEPTSRAVTVRTTAGTVRIPAGRQAAALWLRAPQDQVDEPVEELTTTVTGGTGIRPAPTPQAPVQVVDDDPAPVVSLDDASVTASPLLATPAPVRVRLDRPSSRDLPVVVRTPLGAVTVVVPALAVEASGTVTVPVGRPTQPVQELPLRAGDATATLTVRPPAQTWREAADEAVAAIDWPQIAQPRLF